jgi:hypothetical protein
MATQHITPLDEKLLLSWHGGSDADLQHAAGAHSHRDNASYRPGYGIFRIALVLSLFLGVLAMSPWSPLRIGSAHGMDASGYVYLSVPLNAVEPRFEDTALRVDVRTAGLKMRVLELKQNVGKTRFLPRNGAPRDWRGKQRALASDGRNAGYEIISTAQRRPKARRRTASPKSARKQYLALLRAYEHEDSSRERRLLHPKLMSAYQRALAAR